MLSVTFFYCYVSVIIECCYAECHYAECRYAECCYAECRYAECRGASFKSKNMGANTRLTNISGKYLSFFDEQK